VIVVDCGGDITFACVGKMPGGSTGTTVLFRTE